jgi:O-Antigen ligase
MAAVIERRRLVSYAVLLAALFLAALTVKSGQEVAGIRLLSSSLPLLFLIFLVRADCPISMPRPVLLLIVAECIVLPAISVISKRQISLYEIYLPWTAMSAVLLIVFFRRFIAADLERVGMLYAKSLVPVCLLSFAFTSQQTWFGAYSIASLSDFTTFFALQISLAIPFVIFRWKNAVVLLFLVTLWFLFSRLSLVLSLIAFTIQRTRLNSLRSLIASVATVGGVVVAALLLAQTSLGAELADKLINTARSLFGSGSDVLGALNPSDMGRLAYIVVTLNAITPSSFFFGHGIRTNHEIIAENLDPIVWSLDEGFSVGAVHNVYLELLSDCGIFVLVGLLILAFYVITRLRRRGVRDPAFLSSIIFFLSYFFEGNYVTFFFQFFLIYFLWMAALTRSKKELSEA